jgi:hypothetical protein
MKNRSFFKYQNFHAAVTTTKMVFSMLAHKHNVGQGHRFEMQQIVAATW